MSTRQPAGKLTALRIVLVYAFISAGWILVSDQVLESAIANKQLITELQTIKGWCFVLLTSGLLYGLIRLSQRSLQHSYNMLRSVVEGTSDAVFIKDCEGRYLLANSVVAAILGRPIDAILGHGDREMLPPETARQIQKADQDIMAQGQPVSLEERVPIGGQTHVFWSTKYAWQDSRGRAQGLIGISRDLTDYKQLEAKHQALIQELQQQKEDLQALHLITANAVSTLNLDELLHVLLERLVAVTAADVAVILLNREHHLKVCASRGLSDSQVLFYNSIVGEGFAGTVFRTGKPLYVEDVRSDMRFRTASHEPRPTRSLLGVTLQRESKRIGVLQLEWNTPRPYQERTLHLLEVVAERCTLAIINAQLFEQTRQLKDRLQLQIDRMPIGCLILDANLQFTDWNPAARAIFGYTKAEVLGEHPFARIIPASAQAQVSEVFRRVSAGDMSAHSLAENTTRDGRLILCEWHNTPLLDADGHFTGILSLVQDVTEQKQAEEHLKRLAYFDPLTGLPRRDLFLKRLQTLLDEQRVQTRRRLLAVLYMDVEQFKFIKYSLGHRIAEALLIAIARRLESCLHPPVLIARLESDEFAVLLEYVSDTQEAQRWAETIRQELANPLDIEGHCIFANTCVGIAYSLGNVTDAETLLRSADVAMHQAKATGNAQAVFNHSMAHQVTSALDLDTDLRLALERKQFQLFYQPIVNLENQALVGFESLLRWHHPSRGSVSPAHFIPLAEKTGLILEIGNWVIETTCQQIQHWQQRFGDDHPFLVSINLSALQLRQPDLLNNLERSLRACSIPTGRIKLEMTESAIIENAAWVSDLLVTLKSRQISIVVDDFGTGYSSLSYLNRFPFDTIKLDRSFIDPLATDPASLEIVRSVISLAHKLNMVAIAEGIETVQQLNILQQLDCDLGQGFLFSKAVDSTAAEQLLSSSPSWRF